MHDRLFPRVPRTFPSAHYSFIVIQINTALLQLVANAILNGKVAPLPSQQPFPDQIQYTVSLSERFLPGIGISDLEPVGIEQSTRMSHHSPRLGGIVHQDDVPLEIFFLQEIGLAEIWDL